MTLTEYIPWLVQHVERLRRVCHLLLPLAARRILISLSRRRHSLDTEEDLVLGDGDHGAVDSEFAAPDRSLRLLQRAVPALPPQMREHNVIEPHVRASLG